MVRALARDEGRAVREVPTAGPWPDDVLDGAGLVLLETPSNPGLDVCDIAALAAAAHAAGALVAVDNTTATPLGQRPLELGADLTLASDTKALAGHDDVVLGHVSTRDPALAARLRELRTRGGAGPGPMEAWLAHRGLATLDLRLARQAANAAALVDVLRAHPAVAAVRWPGHPADPAHDARAAADAPVERRVGVTLAVRGRGGPVPRRGAARRVGHQLRRRAHQRRPQAALGRRGAARFPAALRGLRGRRRPRGRSCAPRSTRAANRARTITLA